MSDKLLERLRYGDHFERVTSSERAADRIEELELEIEIWKSRAIHQNEVAGKLEAKLAKAVDFIEDLTGCEWPYDEDAKRILAELKGDNNDQ